MLSPSQLPTFIPPIPSPLSHRPTSCPLTSPPPRMSATADSNTNNSTPATPQDHHLTTDWRAFRAHLIATHRANLQTLHHKHPSLQHPSRWAHVQPTIEVGAVLIANDSHVWPRAFAHLNHAVVLVTDVTSTRVAGLLLNRPTRFTVGEHRSVLGRVGSVFADNVVRLGGDCSTGSLEVLHGLSGESCAGASEIVPGLFRGGFNASRALVKGEKAQAGDFSFFVAYSKWTWDQLNAEMGRGAWRVVSCAPHVLLQGLKGAEQPEKLWKKIMDLVKGEL